MMFKLTLIVWCIATIGFFSREFIDLFKKIFSIPGLTWLVPLLLFSWLIESYQDWGLWLLLQCKAAYHHLELSLDALLPVNRLGIVLIRMAVLWILAGLPLLTAHLMKKHRHADDTWSIKYRVAVFFWITGAILIVMPN